MRCNAADDERAVQSLVLSDQHSGRPLFELVRSYLLLAGVLLSVGLVGLPVALAVADMWWTAVLIAVAAFAAGALFYGPRVDPNRLDALPEATPVAVIVGGWNLLVRCAPFFALLIALGVYSALQTQASPIVPALFLAWGLAEMRRARTLSQWEQHANATLVSEAPRVFVLGRTGRGYRLNRPSPTADARMHFPRGTEN